MRSIAATFERDADAEMARRPLLATSVDDEEITVAPAALGAADDSGNYRLATIVAVLADGNEPAVRDVLESTSGRLVADVELGV